MIKVPPKYEPYVNTGLLAIIFATLAIGGHRLIVSGVDESPGQTDTLELMKADAAASQDCARKTLILTEGLPTNHALIMLTYMNSPDLPDYLKCIQANEAHIKFETYLMGGRPKEPPASAPPKEPWEYRESRDKLRDEVTKWACTTSLDEVVLDYPYGPVRGELCLRNSPRFGKHAIFRIEKGQFRCGLDDCSVSIRFDEKAVRKYRAAESSDHSTGVLFILGYDRFTKDLKRSKNLKIETEYFEAGYQTLTFDVTGLKWD